MTVVDILRIASGGSGVARLPDGMAVFVPRTAPGDRVAIHVMERKRRWARARPEQLLTPGPDRVDPTCRHYTHDRCGGCQLQHIGLETQLEIKRGLVGEAVRRIGRRDVPDPEIVRSPDAWRYRRKITLAVRDGRIGLHPFDDPQSVFELDDCPIADAGLMELWQVVRTHRHLLPADLTELMLRADRDGGWHVVVASPSGDAWDARALARSVDREDVSFWWRPHGGAARVVAGSTRGFPVLAFQQVNPPLAARIRQDAADALAPLDGTVTWDLYGGAGDTAQLLARAGASVWSVDRDRSAVRWAQANLPEGLRDRVTFVAAAAEEALHRLPRPDKVVVNPPRAGLDRRVAARLDRWSADDRGARLAYISCDPATLARDLSRLPSLRLQRAVAYDLFPHTSHVETLAVLESQCAIR